MIIVDVICFSESYWDLGVACYCGMTRPILTNATARLTIMNCADMSENGVSEHRPTSGRLTHRVRLGISVHTEALPGQACTIHIDCLDSRDGAS